MGISQPTDHRPIPRAPEHVFDPVLGSGTSIAAAHVRGRTAYGIELSPAHCDVALCWLASRTREEPILTETGQRRAEVAQSRGILVDHSVNPKQQDKRRIRHNGPAPFYGSRKKAS